MPSIYLVTLAKGIGKEDAPLTHTLLREVRVYIFEETIHPFLIGLEFVVSATTTEFDYSLSFLRSRHTMRVSSRESRGETWLDG